MKENGLDFSSIYCLCSVVWYSGTEYCFMCYNVVILIWEHRKKFGQRASTISDSLCIVQRLQLEQHVVEITGVQCNYICSLELS